MRNLNITGPQVRRLRLLRGWTQEVLAEKLRLIGLEASTSSVAKLEARMLRVAEHHLFVLATIFGVPMTDLFPQIDAEAPELAQILNRYMSESSWENEEYGNG